METPDEIKTRMLKLVNSWTFDEGSDNAISRTMQVEEIYQLARVANALEKIADEGIYVYQCGFAESDEKKKEPDIDDHKM